MFERFFGDFCFCVVRMEGKFVFGCIVDVSDDVFCGGWVDDVEWGEFVDVCVGSV